LPKPYYYFFYGNVFFFNNWDFETTVNKSRITPPKINTIAMGIGSLAQLRFSSNNLPKIKAGITANKFEVKRNTGEKSKNFSPYKATTARIAELNRNLKSLTKSSLEFQNTNEKKTM
jgi:hypothetical protein